MAFGITREELNEWRQQAQKGEIAFLTHFWLDERFPECTSVTKVACVDIQKLKKWGEQYGLKSEWIHYRQKYPHFDLFGERQRYILIQEKKENQLNKLGHKFQ
ncbi:hypothetical protein ACFFHM_15375 [Halalkalibacter kiskunsagensis]|uniref:YneQ n=1 Tax=Halalkalibacter kiskunsagensis TaxID=1548599 RepID=A0ABV6KF23_9BACI